MKRSRRERRIHRIKGVRPSEEAAKEQAAKVAEAVHEEKPRKEGFFNRLLDFYDKKYKTLLYIPFIILILAIIVIVAHTAITGEFIKKGVSLKGGITITIPGEEIYDISELESYFKSQFPENDVAIRELKSAGTTAGLIIEADISDDPDKTGLFLGEVEKKLSVTQDDYAVEQIGSSLGKSFFRETFSALIIAFIFMGIVVFLYFRVLIPSVAVILCALSDIIVTIAIVDLIGIKISTAGIAAFLMLIGYSVDTDILLSTRVLKRKQGTVFQRITGATKTGLTMTCTTLAAVIVGLIITQSLILKQIMLILLIGLIVDIIFTWLQNVGLLRWHVERAAKKAKHND